MRHHNRGNTLMFVLLIGLALMAVTTLLLTTTRSNVQIASERTARAQVLAQSRIGGLSAFREVLGEIPSHMDAKYPTPKSLRSLSRCPELKVFAGGEKTCGEASPNPETTYIYDAGNQAGGGQQELPITLSYTATAPAGQQQTLTMRGSLIYGSNTSGYYTVLADTLTVPDEARVFDGTVYVASSPDLPRNGKVIFAGGLVTSGNEIKLGNTAVPQAHFGPHPAYPCNQGEADCPKFSGGLGVNQSELSVAKAVQKYASSDGFAIPAGTETVILGTEGSSTLMFFCSAVNCAALRLTPDGPRGQAAYEYYGSVPRPPLDGSFYGLPGNLTPERRGITSFLFKGTGNLAVRALQPNGAAYNLSLSLYTPGNITVMSSLLSQNPPCTTYPTVADDRQVIPANCQNSTASTDVLELVAGGNLYIGDASQRLNEGETQMTIHALLMAGGTLRQNDSRLSRTFVAGSLSGHHVDLSHIDLAKDPRNQQNVYALIGEGGTYRMRFGPVEGQE